MPVINPGGVKVMAEITEGGGAVGRCGGRRAF